MCPNQVSFSAFVITYPENCSGKNRRHGSERRWHKDNVKPLYIQIHPRDNVAIIVNPDGLPAGTQFADGLTLSDRIPQAHKVALQELNAGDPVRRYGQIIGLAARPIAQGSWVHEDAIELPRPPALAELPLATATPEPQPALLGHDFDGFRNADGSVGTKNILGITTTVQCVAPTVEYAVRRIRDEVLPRFPQVNDVVAITHTYGCGIAMDAPGAEIPIRTIRHISTHPNLGGTPLVVSLGCEKLQPERLISGKAVREVAGAGERPASGPHAGRARFREVVSAIMRAAEKRLRTAQPAAADGGRRHRNLWSACNAAGATPSPA